MQSSIFEKIHTLASKVPELDPKLVEEYTLSRWDLRRHRETFGNGPISLLRGTTPQIGEAIGRAEQIVARVEATYILGQLWPEQKNGLYGGIRSLRKIHDEVIGIAEPPPFDPTIKVVIPPNQPIYLPNFLKDFGVTFSVPAPRKSYEDPLLVSLQSPDVVPNSPDETNLKRKRRFFNQVHLWFGHGRTYYPPDP